MKEDPFLASISKKAVLGDSVAEALSSLGARGSAPEKSKKIAKKRARNANDLVRDDKIHQTTSPLMQAETAQNIHASNNQLMFSFERERERDVMFHTPPMGPQDEIHKNQD